MNQNVGKSGPAADWRNFGPEAEELQSHRTYQMKARKFAWSFTILRRKIAVEQATCRANEC